MRRIQCRRACDDPATLLYLPPRAGAASLRDSAGHLLRRAHQLMMAAFSDLTAGLDVTSVQFAVPKAIEALEPATQRSIAEYIAMEPGNTTTMLRRLQERGLIGIRSDPADRRRSRIRLTPAGRALLGTVEPLEATVAPRLLSALNAAERAPIVRLLYEIAFGRSS